MTSRLTNRAIVVVVEVVVVVEEVDKDVVVDVEAMVVDGAYSAMLVVVVTGFSGTLTHPGVIATTNARSKIAFVPLIFKNIGIAYA